MIHDPLCPQGECEGISCPCQCQCVLIVKVRFDERQRIIGVMEQNADGDAMMAIDAVLDML
jgi:hypothetical protein